MPANAKNTKLGPGRPGFMEWVRQRSKPNWGSLPLTHITKGVMAEDIMRSGVVEPTKCEVFDKSLAYFFYGRPAYRIAGKGVIKAEALCPFCFVFKPELVSDAKAIHAFDTGAFNRRMYSSVIAEEMDVGDFLLDDVLAADQLISSVFESPEAYFDGDTRVVSGRPPQILPFQFHARAYMDLILSPGRNEPDDRIFTIELVFENDIPISGPLLSVVLPHTLWATDVKAPWIEALSSSSVEIIPYEFVPGRPPEHYHTLLEQAVKRFYKNRGYL